MMLQRQIFAFFVNCAGASGLALFAPASSAQSAVSAWAASAPAGISFAAKSTNSRLVLLGTGAGPFPKVRRSQPSSALEINGHLYLIDTGDGTARQLTAAGFAPSDVDRIFYTHLHFDHTMGLAPLLGFNWMTQRAKHYDVYGPPGTRSFVDRAIAYSSYSMEITAAQMPPVPQIGDLVSVHEVKVSGPTLIYSDENVRVTAVVNTHFSTMAPNKMLDRRGSYSLRFDSRDRSIVFTGDTGYSDAVTQLARGADILVSEVMDMAQTAAYVRRQYGEMKDVSPMLAHVYREHMSPEDVGRLAAKAGVSMVVLSHVGLGNDEETDYRNYTDGVRKFYKGPVIIGMDLMNL